MFGRDDTQNQQMSSQNTGMAPATEQINDPALGNYIQDPSAMMAGMPSYSSPAHQQDLPATAPVTPLETAASDDSLSYSSSETAPPVSGDPSDLLAIKNEAMMHLTPLVSHLEQTPEERFRTTMMMIQASDNQSLVKTAFEAAKQITDDKVRAQAFLDVINEINYFTQQHQ